MSTLVSFLLPSRNPISWLDRLLKSIKDTADDMSAVEIIVRIDDDDAERIALIPKFRDAYGAKFIVGPRGKGYMELGTYYDEMCKEAKGLWCWNVDDDAWLEGKWQRQLEGIRCDEVKGPAVNAELYKLGTSEYRNTSKGEMCGLLLPAKLVKTLSNRVPVDQQWFAAANDRGWGFELLKGVAYCHDGRPR